MILKTCTKCKHDKPIDQFFKRTSAKDGVGSQCKACANAYIRQPGEIAKYVARNKSNGDRKAKRFAEYKATLSCICCGESEAVCLDFHHTDPSTKEWSVVEMPRRFSWDRLMKEIAKCVPLCRNCHAKVHAGLIDLPC